MFAQCIRAIPTTQTDRLSDNSLHPKINMDTLPHTHMHTSTIHSSYNVLCTQLPPHTVKHSQRRHLLAAHKIIHKEAEVLLQEDSIKDTSRVDHGNYDSEPKQK